MVAKNIYSLVIMISLVFAAGCSIAGGFATGSPPTPTTADFTAAESTSTVNLATNQHSLTPTETVSPTSTITLTPTSTEIVFDIGEELTIKYLQELEITGSEITFERRLDDGANYEQHLVSYISEGNKIYGLLTIPHRDPPDSGYTAIVFNHGYIPPSEYRTTERYPAYVDYLARYGFVVFKIDYRGHGESEGEATGSYFSPGYTIDSISALKSLQTLDFIDPQGIGMWGHSMAGNLVLRAMLIEPDIQAGVIWAGAVYSYDDFEQYGINDRTYRPPEPQKTDEPDRRRRSREIIETYGRPDTQTPYWKAVSLTENIEYLNAPLQLHHAENDTVVNIGYSMDLAVILNQHGKEYEFYTYEGGGHNLISPFFDQAMILTVEFFWDNL